jgi:hypothetical protein
MNSPQPSVPRVLFVCPHSAGRFPEGRRGC